jgi:hypothetical protein
MISLATITVLAGSVWASSTAPALTPNIKRRATWQIFIPPPVLRVKKLAWLRGEPF